MLHLSKFLVKERVAMLKLTDAYDIFDPETGKQVGTARENVPAVTKYLRLLVSKKLLPTRIDVTDGEDGELQFSIRRGVAFLRSRVDILGPSGNLLGYFRSKLFSLGGGFWVFDSEDRQVSQVKGEWKGWNFKFLDASGEEIGTVTKKWAGIGKEMFTSADNYIIAIRDDAASPATSVLLLAAGLAIDTVYKEGE